MTLRRRVPYLAVAGYVAIVLVVVIAATWIRIESLGRVVDEGELSGERGTALVLGSLVRDGEPGDYVRARLDTALELYKSGAVRRIINSGNPTPEAGNEPAVMRAYLEERGVPPEDIVDDPHGMDTSTSCRNVRGSVDGGWRPADGRVVIVTQDFHVRRAIALCRAEGVDAVGVEAGCDCAAWTVARNLLRETFLAGPRAVLTRLGI